MKLIIRLIILLFLLLSTPSFFMSTLQAKEQETEIISNDSIEARKKWVMVPVAAYGSETGTILGASLFYFPPPSANSTRNSSLDIILFGTTKGQYFFTLGPDLYLDNERYRLRPKLFGSYWKSSYYGIGNELPDEPEDYDSSNIGIKLSLDRLYPNRFTLGPA